MSAVGGLREYSMRFQHLIGLFSCVAAATFGADAALGATVTNINTTITNSGSCGLVTGCPENYSVYAYAGSTTQMVNMPTSASFGFTDSFNQGSNLSTGSNLGVSATGSGAPWNFQDNILFDTSGAKVQAQASALLTNVSDLQIRIIALDNPATGNPFDITSAANASALLGGSTVVTIENGWTNFTAGPIDYTATMLNAIPAGDYILQVRGEAQAGSSYSGTISFTPVPLPSTLIMLLSGLGLVGAAGARSQRHGIRAAQTA
jgi:hypothetical protein